MKGTPPRLLRRLWTPVPVALLLVALVVATAVAVVGLVAAVFDRRARLLRLAAMVAIYAGLELVVLAVLLSVWVMRLARMGGEELDRRAVGWALDTFVAAARPVLGFRVELEEPPSLGPFAQDGPVLVLARHGGIGDSFALVHLLLTRYGRRPRVVLKRLLLLDPMLDVALTRMGACWVGRSKRDGDGRSSGREAVGAMAAGAGPQDAILLFPEGGNWTPRRRVAALARLWRSGRRESLRTAALMEHVLPPRPGGVTACLDARPDLPVVVMAHTGLDRVTSFGGLWAALPFKTAMRLRWWTTRPAPAGDEARSEWLTTEWAVVDQWIDASRPADPEPGAAEVGPPQ